MKTKPIFFLVLLAAFVLLNNQAFPQQTKDQQKTSTTTETTVKSEPVPGAEITVEQVPGPVFIKKCVTDKDGKFTVMSEEIELAIEKIERAKIALPEEITLQVTIKPKDPSRFPVENNSVVIKVKKSDGPKFTFVVTYQKPTTKSNKGYFAISSKAQSGW
jgi:hypothetical protein